MSTDVRSPSHLRLSHSETVAVGGLGAIVVAAALSPARIDDGPVLCPFRRLTGLPCPGCGMTRSWVHTMHGQWHAAIDANPFGPVALVAVVVLAVYAATRRLRGGPAPDLEHLVRTPPAIALVVAWLGFSAVRLVLAM